MRRRSATAARPLARAGTRSGRSSRLWGLLLALSAVGGHKAAQDVPARAGELEITVVDRETGQPLACRMHLLNPHGRPHRPRGVPFWHYHFVFDGSIRLDLPNGRYTFEMECGPEYHTRSGHFVIEDFANDTKRIDMLRFVDMAARGWYSGDLYVRRDPKDVELLMRAEDLHVAEVVTWWNDETSTSMASRTTRNGGGSSAPGGSSSRTGRSCCPASRGTCPATCSTPTKGNSASWRSP